MDFCCGFKACRGLFRVHKRSRVIVKEAYPRSSVRIEGAVTIVGHLKSDCICDSRS